MNRLNLLLISLCLGLSSMVNASTLYPSEKENIQVFQQVAPLVVNVHNMRQVRRHAENVAVEAGLGSGFVWDDKGHIITNFHVIHNAKGVVVSLQDGQSFPAEIIGAEPRKDIAVLVLKDPKALKALKSLKPLRLADSTKLQVGQRAIAIGNPFGLDQSMTIGIVSARNRRIMGITGISIADMIQTDAAVNPGNSGGPLLDSRGQLIGMNTLIYSSSGASNGVGFAVPVNDIKRIANQIINQGRVVQPGLGIQLLDSGISQRNSLHGVVIGKVVPGSPAAKAGLRGTRRNVRGMMHLGDIIIALNGKPVKDYDDLYNLMDDMKVGQTVTVTILRDKKKQTVKIKTIDLSTG